MMNNKNLHMDFEQLPQECIIALLDAGHCRETKNTYIYNLLSDFDVDCKNTKRDATKGHCIVAAVFSSFLHSTPHPSHSIATSLSAEGPFVIGIKYALRNKRLPITKGKKRR
jgi:hypothetical protein